MSKKKAKLNNKNVGEVSRKDSKAEGIIKTEQYKYLSYFLLAGIVLLSLYIYFDTYKNGFINWDDDGYVINNPDIKDFSLAGIYKLFHTFYLGNYHPLTMLVYTIEYKLFGMSAGAFHTTNVIIHLINILLVFWFILELSGKQNIAIIVALFFAIHPMHTESVCWVAETKDVLYSAFYLASIIFYLKYINTNKTVSSNHQIIKLFHFAYIVSFIIIIQVNGSNIAVTAVTDRLFCKKTV